ncbi:MAG: ATP-dependent zinc metalloprotease FtsH [Anaerolineaceae bacterium]|nr:ATP-dependent zinc metalloprotease FtsH [Anaerolineaceae bacterium]MCY4008860.1 ATP-dependent zinc metalloprotease FtsH [Anaerolineaceae bacterium]
MAAFFFFYILPNSSNRGSDTNWNELASLIQSGQVSHITERGGQEVIIRLRNHVTRRFTKEPEINLFDHLSRYYGVSPEALQIFTYETPARDNTSGIFLELAFAILPTLIIVWLIWRMLRSVRGSNDQAVGFGRSRARVTRDAERPQVTFADVAGVDESKEELAEIVEFLKEPEKFIRLGARVPKGVLMIGPPGTGKTLLARAVAGEAGVPFFSISGSEFVEMFVGVGASRVRDLFEKAKSEAPSIVFIDEIDAVGRHRGAGLGGGHDEREQTLNQILVEMDGFETGTNIIIIAATNRPDILDPALLRPGRFDRKVLLDTPDISGRRQILNVHARGKPISEKVDLDALAKITAGFSGADLENLINEAAILAARRDLKLIRMSELQESMERIVMGPERRTRVITPAEQRKVAFHEAGHAILHHVLKHALPVHKITIVSRGRAGGYVMPLLNDDSMLKTQEEFEDQITAAMGGRAAEEIVYRQLSTGASNDLQQATQIARAMVTQFGMSEQLGPRAFGRGNGAIFLGRELAEQRDYSEEAARQIDVELQQILNAAYERAKSLLSEHRVVLDALVERLLERETLDSESFQAFMQEQGLAAPSAINPA